jgi:hypothetical protein
VGSPDAVSTGGRNRRRKKRAQAATKEGKTGEDRWKIEQRKQEEQRKRDDAERERYKKAFPMIAQALAGMLKKAARKTLTDVVLGAVRRDSKATAAADELMPRMVSAEDVLGYLAFVVLYQHAGDSWGAWREFPKQAKAYGINVKAIVDEAAPPKQEVSDAAEPEKLAPRKPQKTKGAKKVTPKKKGRK